MKKLLFITLILLSILGSAMYWTGNFTQTSEPGVYTAYITAENPWFIIHEDERTFTVGETIPETPILLTPTDNNDTVQERRPEFTWEPQGGITPEYYTINITNSCSSIPLRNITETTYTSIEELCTEETYTWTVRACIEEDCSEWAEPYNFTIQSIIGVTLEQNTTDFGTLDPSTQQTTIEENTLDNNPLPLILRNTGNVRIHVDAKATESLWDNQPLGTRYLQFADQDTTEWTNATTEYQRHTTTLMYNNTRELELRVQVPIGEPPGTKSTTIQVLGESAE